MKWSLENCYKQMSFIDFAGLVGKDINLKQIYVSVDENKHYVGTDEIVTVRINNFDISNDPAYLTYHYVRDDGVSHECSSPAYLFIQYGVNAFACLSTTGPDYINDLIALMQKWDSPQAEENIRVLNMGFTL